MIEPIAYAMTNAEAKDSLLYFNHPLSLKSWTFNLVELVTILGAGLVLLHAIREYRERGARAPLFTWIAALFYGIILEILSYNFVDNFWHGEFTVMLYHNRFPLYISLIYPALLYHGYMTVRRFELDRLRFGRIIEAVSVGIVVQALYCLYDNLGPLFHWWIWSPDHPTLQPMWQSVPSSSYHWCFGFSAAFALLVRLLIWERDARRHLGNGMLLLLAAGVAIATSVLGAVLFLPYNILATGVKNAFDGLHLYPLAGLLIAVYLFGGTWLFVLAPKRYPRSPDWLLLVFPLTWCSLHLGLYAYSFDALYRIDDNGITSGGTPIGNVIIGAAGMALSLYATHQAHLHGWNMARFLESEQQSRSRE